MTYLKVAWMHQFPDEPVEFLSELDEERYETRKIERYRNGILHFAGPQSQSGKRGLSENPIPTDDLIHLTPELRILPTTAEEFNQLWHSALISTAA